VTIGTKLYRYDVRKVLYKKSLFCYNGTINMAAIGNVDFRREDLLDVD